MMEKQIEIIATHHVEVGGLYKLYNHLLEETRVFYGLRYFQKVITHKNIYFLVLETKRVCENNKKFTKVKILTEQEMFWVILINSNNILSGYLKCDTPVEV